MVPALKTLEESQWLPLAEIRALQLSKLKSILNHAYSTVPFYRRAFDKHKLKPDDIQSIEDLKLSPLLEKHDLSELSSTLRLPRRKMGRYSTRMTAGTSGIPSIVYVDNEAGAESLAARFRSQGSVVGSADGARCALPESATEHPSTGNAANLRTAFYQHCGIGRGGAAVGRIATGIARGSGESAS